MKNSIAEIKDIGSKYSLRGLHDADGTCRKRKKMLNDIMEAKMNPRNPLTTITLRDIGLNILNAFAAIFVRIFEMCKILVTISPIVMIFTLVCLIFFKDGTAEAIDYILSYFNG